MRSIRQSVMHRLLGARDTEPGLCAHLQAAPASDADITAPRACQGCAAEGLDHWAHLRQCLTCGYVGCCDSSPAKHATAHHKSSLHPVMRSAEPGETWRWCYVDAEIG